MEDCVIPLSSVWLGHSLFADKKDNLQLFWGQNDLLILASTTIGRIELRVAREVSACRVSDMIALHDVSYLYIYIVVFWPRRFGRFADHIRPIHDEQATGMGQQTQLWFWHWWVQPLPYVWNCLGYMITRWPKLVSNMDGGGHDATGVVCGPLQKTHDLDWEYGFLVWRGKIQYDEVSISADQSEVTNNLIVVAWIWPTSC